MTADSRFDAKNPIEKEALKIIWSQACTDLSKILGDKACDRWFSPLELVDVTPDETLITAPNSIYPIWIDMNFKKDLEGVFDKYFLNYGSVKFKVIGGGLDAGYEEVKDMVEADASGKVILNVDSDQADFNLGLDDPKRDKKGKDNSDKEMPSKIQRHHECPDLEKLRKLGGDAGLKEDHYFENFVIGDSNQMAAAAAEAVAKQPGRTYQPLFLHSDSGLGKTHLLHAIGWRTLELRPKSKVAFMTAEEFTNEYVDALQNNALVKFRKKYRKVDLLLIDDVQFLAKKSGIQEEFFHTFNSLNDSRKQIVLTSDLPVHEIRKLESRLKSRFQWGLTTEIHAPSEETRSAILRQKRDEWNLTVSNEVVDFLASRIQDNVRLLEGALIRCSLALNLSDVGVDFKKLEIAIADLQNTNDHERLTPEQIQNVVAEEYGLTPRDLSGRRRTAQIAEARHVAMLLSREMTEYSLVEIGEIFCRDHGTVIHGMNSLRNKMEASTSIRGTVEKLRRVLKRGGSGGSGKSQSSERG